MFDYSVELDREIKAQNKRWNGKIIITGRQWSNNSYGSREVDNYSADKIWAAVRDYQNSREW